MQTSLNHNRLYNVKLDIVAECFSESDLSVAIEKYLHLSTAEIASYKVIGKRMREIFFTPITEAGMANFISM